MGTKQRLVSVCKSCFKPRGSTRPYSDSRGRGRGRGSARYSRENHDWHDQTGSNGDVTDRRRGSGDSDQMDVCFATDDERADHQPVQNEHLPRKRSDQNQSAQSAGPRQDIDDGYRASDEYEPGENGGQPNGVPRSKAAATSARQRYVVNCQLLFLCAHLTKGLDKLILGTCEVFIHV